MEWTDWKNITAEQIGAEPAQTIATQEEAEEGTATAVRSWTAQLIRQAISAVTTAINNALTFHVNARDNPHGVTAAQVSAAAATHNHNASNINAGTLPLARGGTNATTAAAARTSLGVPAIAHNHNAADINAGTLPVARGGTAVTTFATTAVAITLTHGWSGLVCRRTFDNFVYIRGSIRRNVATTITQEAVVPITTLPAGSRPNSLVVQPLQSNLRNIGIHTNGGVMFTVGSANLNANSALDIFVMFRID